MGGVREMGGGVIQSLLLLKGSCNYDPLLVYFNREKKKKSGNNEIVVNMYLARTLSYLSTKFRQHSNTDRNLTLSAQTAF